MDLGALKRAVIMLKFSSPSYRSTYGVHMHWERISPFNFYGNFKTWKWVKILFLYFWLIIVTSISKPMKNQSSITLVLHLYEVGHRERKWISTLYRATKVRDDPKLPCDSGGVPIPEWNGVRFPLWNLLSTSHKRLAK